MLSWKINENSLAEITRLLSEVDKKIVRKVLRKGMRNWAKQIQQKVKSNISWQERNRGLKKSIITKSATYKRGRVVWTGVGIAGDEYTSSKGEVVDLRSKANWYNNGWHAYPKGQKSDRKGRGWRKGLRGQKGNKVYETKFFDDAYQGADKLLIQAIEDSIREAIQE